MELFFLIYINVWKVNAAIKDKSYLYLPLITKMGIIIFTFRVCAVYNRNSWSTGKNGGTA